MLTLRQIEIVRAIAVSGSVAGAAKLLNVAQPGISRAMKHIEATLGLKLFVRRAGRYTPAPEATGVFRQINEIHRKVDDLGYVLSKLSSGEDVELRLGSVPSIANAMVPNAVAEMRRAMPDLALNIELLKIEEAIDYLLLQRGEMVLMSYRLAHPALAFTLLAHGSLKFVVPPDHPCANHKGISVEEIADYSLIGIDPNDPYGRIMAELFERANLEVRVPIKARFGSTVISLVERRVGVAVLDSFSIAGIGSDRLRAIPIEAETRFPVYYATRNDWTLSSSAEKFLHYLRATMKEHC